MSVEQTTIYLPGFFGCKTISSGHGKQDGAGWLLQAQAGRVGGLGEGLLGQKVLYIPLFLSTVAKHCASTGKKSSYERQKK